MKALLKNFLIFILVLLPGYISFAGGADHASHDEANEHEESEPQKGPHGGRLLEKDGFQLEIVIFESGVPPQFRLFAYEHKKPIQPTKINATVELIRISRRIDRFIFTPQDDYLTSSTIVEEPHSFDVKVDAQWNGKTFSWVYPSYEGRTEISQDAIQYSGISSEIVGPSKLKVSIPVNGRIVLDEDRLAHVSPRFPGVVKEVKKRLGDLVKQGDLLAVIESNANLNRYEIRAPLSGTIVKKDITIGEFLSEKDTIYIVSDLSKVWVDLNIYRQDFTKIKVGQTLQLNAIGSTVIPPTKISYISPLGSEYTQSTLARAILSNRSGEFLPGLFVSGVLVLEELDIPIAIRSEAVQKFRDWDVVFMQEGNIFEVIPLELGRSDGEWVEVIKGINPGQRYVTKNSFIVKADILKSGASHDH